MWTISRVEGHAFHQVCNFRLVRENNDTFLMSRWTRFLPIWRRVALSTSRTNWLDLVCVQVAKRQTSTPAVPLKASSREPSVSPKTRSTNEKTDVPIWQMFPVVSLYLRAIWGKLNMSKKVNNGVIKEISDDPWKCCLCSFHRLEMCRKCAMEICLRESKSRRLKFNHTAGKWCEKSKLGGETL